jgi:hypothetical protein
MEIHELRTAPHPPYSTDLASTNFFLFDHLKRTLHGSEFDNAEELLDAVVKILNVISPETLLATFHQLMDRRQACIHGEGASVEWGSVGLKNLSSYQLEIEMRREGIKHLILCCVMKITLHADNF